jgi:hypothetical protein
MQCSTSTCKCASGWLTAPNTGPQQSFTSDSSAADGCGSSLGHSSVRPLLMLLLLLLLVLLLLSVLLRCNWPCSSVFTAVHSSSIHSNACGVQTKQPTPHSNSSVSMTIELVSQQISAVNAI